MRAITHVERGGGGSAAHATQDAYSRKLAWNFVLKGGFLPDDKNKVPNEHAFHLARAREALVRDMVCRDPCRNCGTRNFV
jgi:hypothetical protein